MALEDTPASGGTSTSSRTSSDEETEDEDASTPTQTRDGNLRAPPSDSDGEDDTTEDMDDLEDVGGSGEELDAPSSGDGSTDTDTDGGADTDGGGGELRAPEQDTGSEEFAGGKQQTTPATGGEADAPPVQQSRVQEPAEQQTSDQSGGRGLSREDFESAAGFVKASASEAFPSVGSGEVFTARSGSTVEARFTERGARQATAALAGEGVNPDDVSLGEQPAGGYSIDDVSSALEREREDLGSDLQQLSEERESVREDALENARIEAGMEARAEAQRRSQELEETFKRGNLAPTRDVREEAAAREVSDELGFEVTSDDIQVSEGDDGSLDVELSDEAQRASQVTSSAEFLRRDASIERTESGDFDVELPGDNPAVETAIERKIETGEAFGGETKFSVLGQTVNVEQATEDIASAVNAGASDAVDFVDDANILSGRPAFVDDETSQQITGAQSGREAGEDVVLRAGEQAAAALGNAPKDVLEVGEAAVDPLTYRAAGNLAGSGADALDDVSVDAAVSAGKGVVETAERVDEAAQENPEAATAVVAGGLGGAAAIGGSFAASSRVLSGVGALSPKAARGLEVALDPVRTTAGTAARAARRVDTPDAGSLRRLGIPDDNRAQANPLQMGRQQSRGDVDTIDDQATSSDVDAGGGSDFEPSRDYLLEGGTQERARLDLVEQQRADLEASRGDFEGEPDAFGRGREATFDPEQDVLEPDEILESAQRFEADVGTSQFDGLARTADFDATDAATSQRSASLFASEIATDATTADDTLDFAPGSIDQDTDATATGADSGLDDLGLGDLDDDTMSGVDTDAATRTGTDTGKDTTTADAASVAPERGQSEQSEFVTETTTTSRAESEAEAASRARARGRGRLNLPEFDGGDVDADLADDDSASDIFDNPTISPEEALRYNPLED